MKSIVALARELHGGTNVYKSRQDCLAVLQAVEKLQLPWWSASCANFLRQVENVEVLDAASVKRADTAAPLGSPPASASGTAGTASSRSRHPVIVVEGLDGTGKTTITRALAQKLHGTALSTPPPQFAHIRDAFRHQDEAVARAFYSAANYVAAQTIAHHAASSIVVVDRWWCSTCAMALANQRTVETLPPAGDPVYVWPTDLLRPDVGFLLHVTEEVRVGRIRKRAPEDAEERRLSARQTMREAAMTAYARTKVLADVAAPSYMAAVNAMLLELSRRGIAHDAAPYSAEELNSITPF